MIRLRHLHLAAITRDNTYSAELTFRGGLNVVHAGNTSGKSTCLQAIIYALGLERSLGPQLDIPLPYAMRERIHSHRDQPYEVVIQSYVELELENGHGTILRVRRDVVGGADTKLIRTWSRQASEVAHQREKDFFVLDPGAAQRDDGFHYHLANFMGWELPLVPRFDGSEGPLYLEAMFPMLFVEQKRGWSAIQGPFPTFLRIQDVTRRVMEFLLDLDAGRIRRDRADLRRQLSGVQQEWINLRAALASQLGNFTRLRGVPAAPTAEFAKSPSIGVEVFQTDTWVSLEEAVTTSKNSSRRLKHKRFQPPEMQSQNYKKD
jgi:hypothetical protein